MDCFQALVGEVQGNSVNSTVENHYRVSVFYASLDRVTGELKYRFQSDDNDILCMLGEVCLKQDAQNKSFEKVTEYYAIDKEIRASYDVHISGNSRRYKSGEWVGSCWSVVRT